MAGMKEPDVDALVEYALDLPEFSTKPTPLARQAHIAEQERKAESALEEMLRRNPDLRQTCKSHRWFVAQIARIEEAERASGRAQRG